MSNKIYIGIRKKLGFDNEVGSSGYNDKAIYYKPEGARNYFQLDICYDSMSVKSQNRVEKKCLHRLHDYVTIEDDGVARLQQCSKCGHIKKDTRRFFVANIYHEVGLPENKRDYKEVNTDDILISIKPTLGFLDKIYN